MTIREKPWYQGVLLGGFSLFFAVVMGFGYNVTAPDIKDRMNEDLNASLKQVIPNQYWDNDLTKDTISITTEDDGTMTIYRATKNGAVSALAYRVTGQGYSGNIIIVMGINRDGKILGVRVIKHAETPGLGDKIDLLKSKWITSFNGLSLKNTPLHDWAVKKDGGRFDQFSGATITPRGVVRAVHHGLDIFSEKRSEMLKINPAPKDSNAGARSKQNPASNGDVHE